MREIKFRAWDRKENKMWYDDTSSRFNDVLKMPYKQNLIVTMRGEIRTCQFYENGVTMHDFGDFELMQFTGLKDKNGREIYEDDILDFENGYISQVEFRGVSFLLRDGQLRTDLSHGVIIGNIYENPELLK